MDTKMEKEFHDLKSKVDDIHRFLFGSEHEEDVGILYRIRKNEADIQNFKDWKARITYFAYGMVVPASYGIFDIIKSILLTISR